jgi:hypothetical protein
MRQICVNLRTMPDEVSGGGGPPRDQSLETRVSAVKARLDRVETAIEELRKELQGFRLEFIEFRAEMRGRLTNIPTTFQIAFMLAAFTVATFIGATGLSLAILRLAGVH